MNILIPNSWLKEYLETNATPKQFAEAMSLTSVSIERIEEIDGDYVFDIEVTTNRPDLMSIEGIAREASAVLPQAGYNASFKKGPLKQPKTVSKSPLIDIVNDPALVNRILAVVMEVKISKSPKLFEDRLTKTGIRSLNNVIDVTNYIMRENGHPAHVFDYDRLTTKKLIIRKSKPGERIVTLDEKEYTLAGGDIIADDGTGKIVDLLGIMGTANSVVTDDTKKVLLFLNNNNPHVLRKTSMSLGIRTEAAVLNEKGIDPELMIPTLLNGIGLLGKYADGKVISEIIDIYPKQPVIKPVAVSYENVDKLIGIKIPEKIVKEILKDLGFEFREKNKETLLVTPPTTRANDIEIEEDIIEEIARVYGYHKIPNILPSSPNQAFYHQEKDEFYWLQKIKESLCLWGFNEVYTYSMVSEELFDGPIEDAVTLKNPLTDDHIYMRNSLTPSLIKASSENKTRDAQRLFEISNVYEKKAHGLPNEVLHLVTLFKGGDVTFYEVKGVVEQLLQTLGIENLSLRAKSDGIEGAVLLLGSIVIGQIEVGEEMTFEIDMPKVLPLAHGKKQYKVPSKFPPIIEDVRVEIDPSHNYESIENKILLTDELIKKVELLDVYGEKKTFRIYFQSYKDNLTNETVTPIREKLYETLKGEFKAKIG